MRRKLLFLLSALALLLVPLAPAQAIVNGVPDDNAHPYVGEVLFYVPMRWFRASVTRVHGSPAPRHC